MKDCKDQGPNPGRKDTKSIKFECFECRGCDWPCCAGGWAFNQNSLTLCSNERRINLLVILRLEEWKQVNSWSSSQMFEDVCRSSLVGRSSQDWSVRQLSHSSGWNHYVTRIFRRARIFLEFRCNCPRNDIDIRICHDMTNMC